jgi:phospholipase/lecithinase/hemolysin
MTFPKSLRLFAFTALLTPLLSLHASTASPYDAIYVFGDSYCDVGNISLATGGAIPGPLYYNGRFSNGPIWVEHVASAWGLPMLPSLKGGTDYAVGGAEVTTSVSNPLGTIPSVPEQVLEYLQYLQAHGGRADPHALYILEGGGNDILNATGGSPAVLGLKIAAGLAGSELLLRQAGARNFVIPDLLNVALLPAGQLNPTFAAAATIAVNKSLDQLLQFEQLLEGIKIYRLGVFSLFNAVAADATHFGFVNITTPCLSTTGVCADPDHTLFYDAEHPTEFGHSFFAVLLESRLSQ